MWVGTGGRPTDGVKDAHGVGQSAPAAIFHRMYLAG